MPAWTSPSTTIITHNGHFPAECSGGENSEQNLPVTFHAFSQHHQQDFEGQRIADTLVRDVLIGTTVSVPVSALLRPLTLKTLQVLAFILGIALQSLRVTFGTVALGTVLLVIVSG